MLTVYWIDWIAWIEINVFYVIMDCWLCLSINCVIRTCVVRCFVIESWRELGRRPTTALLSRGLGWVVTSGIRALVRADS